MPEYLRHAAGHVAWLLRQKRRERTETGQLAARIGRILQRRGAAKGLAGLVGADELRRAAGLVRPAPGRLASAPPDAVKRTTSEPELVEPQEQIAASPPKPEVLADIERVIEEAAAEAAHVEEPPTEPLAEEAVFETLVEQERLEEQPGPPEETADLARVVEEIQTVPPELEQPARPAPARTFEPEPVSKPHVKASPVGALPDEEMPFEAAIEPRSLIPREARFERSADEVLFNRAIERLGMRESSSVREGIELLGRVRGDAAAGTLINLYRIAPPRWRPHVAHQLVNHAAAGLVEFFSRVLDEHDEPPVVRIAALRGLYARDKALAADALLGALGDPSAEVRATAATYVGWLRERRALPGLEQLIGDPSRQVAEAALRAASAIRG
jgi:hypothetical protein